MPYLKAYFFMKVNDEVCIYIDIYILYIDISLLPSFLISKISSKCISLSQCLEYFSNIIIIITNIHTRTHIPCSLSLSLSMYGIILQHYYYCYLKVHTYLTFSLCLSLSKYFMMISNHLQHRYFNTQLPLQLLLQHCIRTLL